MGNTLNVSDKNINTNTSKWFSKFKPKKRIPSDKFIIDFSKRYDCKLNQITDVNSLDSRRIVFVSLIGLFQTYKQCPLYMLYTAIFILPLKKEWLYNLSKYINKNDQYLNQLKKLTMFYSETEFNTFIQLLQWKDSQRLLFCMKDEYKHTKISLADPFWYHLSNKLCKLYSTCNKYKYTLYNPLYLDDKWWENIYSKNKYKSKYNVNSTDILNELYFKTMKFNTIKEILYQSNPNLLNPVSFYGENNDRFQRYSSELFYDSDNSQQVDEKEGDWYLSIDYD
eukprot:318539_1